MNELLLQVAMGFFGVILATITALMAYMTKAVVNATNKIGILELSLKTTEDILKSMAIDLRIISKHDSLIAVLQTEVANIKADVQLLFERVREDRKSVV